MADTIAYYDLISLAKRAGISSNALNKRAARANRTDSGALHLKGVGYVTVRKKGKKEWRFIPLKVESGPEMILKSEAQKSMVKVLTDLSGYVCQDCIEIVGQVITNV